MKSARFWSFSSPYLPAFGLNTERYSGDIEKGQLNEIDYYYGNLFRMVGRKYVAQKESLHEIDSLNLGGFVTSFENFLFCVAEQ